MYKNRFTEEIENQKLMEIEKEVTPEIKSKNPILWIFLIIIVVAFAVTITKITLDKKIPKDEYVEKINYCLKNGLDYNCTEFFSRVETYQKCQTLNESKDICIYTAAQATHSVEYCEKISKEELKSKCNSENFINNFPTPEK